jgi:hypothetical protein|tara:strand:+ start:67 stop:252 length:186 start_codon:yes stop_codon:yes gene_type:complete
MYDTEVPHILYTMQDVNKVIMDRGWPRLVAMSYFIDLADVTGQMVSDNLKNNYSRETRTNA